MAASRMVIVTALFLNTTSDAARAGGKTPTADEVRAGLRSFYQKTARPDGSFQPGVDPTYKGMSDSAASDLAPPTYAVVLHRTFGWKLPDEAKTVEFFHSRQTKDGAFFHVAGTMDPKSAQARLYNTTQGLVAMRGLGVKPRYDGAQVFAPILVADYKTLPPFTTSFFPLAYLAAGKAIPKDADDKIRALMNVQDEDGYLHNHIANTFHMVHYYRLVGEKTVPKADKILARVLREQNVDGSWLINPPARDRHAGFDAVFTLVHLAPNKPESRRAIDKCTAWVLRCRNADGGFGHYPGSTSDADAVYFHVGTLVMAGFLRAVDPLPPNPELLGWGHLMPRP